MIPRTRFTLRVGHAAALAGVVGGGVAAALSILPRTWVREFQAGEPSGLGEKLYAVLVQSGIEGLGFGLLGLVLGGLAALLTRPGSGAAPARGVSGSTSPTGEPARDAAWSAHLPSALGNLLLVAAAFFAWESFGAWLGGELLPLLPTLQVIALDIAAVGGLLVGLLVFRAIVVRLPLTPRDAPVAVALGCLAALALAARFALEIVTAESGGWRSPVRLGLAAGCFVLVLPAAALVARVLRSVLDRLGALHGSHPGFARLSFALRLWLSPALALGEHTACSAASSQGRENVPRLVARAGNAWALVAVLAAFTAPFFTRASAAPVYEELALERQLPAGGPRAVVFVTVDTLRADHLSCYGYERETSPFLDSVAASGTRFADPVASAAWTKPATGTLLTGLYPSRHGALYHGSSLMVPEGERTLAEAFQDAGYTTAGFVSNPNLKRVFAFDRGFDEFFDAPVEDTLFLATLRDSRIGVMAKRLLRRQWNWKYENDVLSMNEHVLAWLDANASRPFFLYAHYIDPHEPYEPPEPYASDWVQDHGFVIQNERKELVGRDLYDAEIRYTDDGLAELVAALEARGLWDDTLFVLTSDHGEEWFEHGILGHGFSLRQSVVGVPLILRGPGVPVGRVVEAPVQLLDLPATLLELAETGATELGDGSSFTALLHGEGATPAAPLFLENEFGEDDHDLRSFVFTGVREGPWKLVKTEVNAYEPDAPEFALYHLGEDPEERVNRFDDVTPEVAAVRARLLAELLAHGGWLDEHGQRHLGPPAQMDPATEAQLRALGYL